MVKVKIRAQDYSYKATPKEQSFLNEILNEPLKDIAVECVAYNAYVDACVMTDSENYVITAVCDDYAIEAAMQERLPRVIPSFL